MSKDTKKSPVALISILLVFALVVIGIMSYFLFSNKGEETVTSDGDTETTTETAEEVDEAACDNTTDDFQTVYRNESVTIIENPCEIIWLLAQIEEEYTLETKNGTLIYVTVWRDWENNVTPGTTFTIRGLETEDAAIDFESHREESNILITRHVESESDLEAAKEEFNKAVESLEY